MAKILSSLLIGVSSPIGGYFSKFLQQKLNGNDMKLFYSAQPSVDNIPPPHSAPTEFVTPKPKERLRKDNEFNFQNNSEKQEVKQDFSNLKPVPSLMNTGFSVAINFSNNFKLPAKIYSRRGFEKDFKFLSIDTNSPYIDNRIKLDSNIPEEREYRLIYMDEENEVGEMSEIVKITL